MRSNCVVNIEWMTFDTLSGLMKDTLIDVTTAITAAVEFTDDKPSDAHNCNHNEKFNSDYINLFFDPASYIA